MDAIRCYRVDSYGAVHEAGVGAFCWGERRASDGTVWRALRIWLPDGICSLLVGPQHHPRTADRETVWQHDGNDNRPTLHPSVLNPEEGGWHGFIQDGELITV